MTDKKSWGHTVVGWFIESDAPQPEGGAPSTEERPPVAEAAPPAVERVFASNPPAAINGQVDFDAVFTAAGISDEDRGRVTKAQDLLASLPPDTPVAVKKQIVEASLKAFGVPIDDIIKADFYAA